jgi:hypothetical protein
MTNSERRAVAYTGSALGLSLLAIYYSGHLIHSNSNERSVTAIVDFIRSSCSAVDARYADLLDIDSMSASMYIAALAISLIAFPLVSGIMIYAYLRGEATSNINLLSISRSMVFPTLFVLVCFYFFYFYNVKIKYPYMGMGRVFLWGSFPVLAIMNLWMLSVVVCIWIFILDRLLKISRRARNVG